MSRGVQTWVPAGLAMLAACAIAGWLVAAASVWEPPRLPRDGEGGSAAPDRADSAKGVTITGTGKPAEVATSWPSFRGAARDAVSPERINTQWGPDGPKVLWSASMGEGYAGAAIAGGCAYVMDYDQQAQADALRCLSLSDGAEVWRYSYRNPVRRYHGVSRTVPAVSGNRVVAMGPLCHVICADARTGALVWSLDLVRDFGTTVPEWYAGQCPLIDGGKVILAPGGPDALLAAVDLETGQVLWKTPNPGGWKMTHSSVAIMQLGEKRTYVYCGSGGVAGVDAGDGSLLWESPDWKVSLATVPTPVDCGEGRLLLTGGYGAGSAMLRIEQSDGSVGVRTLWRQEPKVFGSEQHTPVRIGEHVFGVLTRDAGAASSQLACLGIDGKQAWTSGTKARFGGGSYMQAGDVLLVLDDNGTLVAARATAEGYFELARAKVLSGPESWAPMALAGGRLVIRDMKTMKCLDLTP
jgi:outer membrane protein assembly factor BamB